MVVVVVVVLVQRYAHSHRYHFRRAAQQGPTSIGANLVHVEKKYPSLYCMLFTTIGTDSTGATGNFAPVLTQEPGQTLRFAPVPFMAVL